jgi:hypothetical protein
LHDGVVLKKIIVLTLSFSLCGCIYTKSGNSNFNRIIEITVTSGNAYFDISGHISEDVYAYNYIEYKERGTVISAPKMEKQVVSQGKKTISEKVILYKTQKFKYTLTTAEVVIMNVKSLDGNDATVTVFEYGQTREYKIDGNNQFGRTILFKN